MADQSELKESFLKLGYKNNARNPPQWIKDYDNLRISANILRDGSIYMILHMFGFQFSAAQGKSVEEVEKLLLSESCETLHKGLLSVKHLLDHYNII